MRNEIIGFIKSNHAFKRQWERAIPDKLIYLALRNYSGEFLFQTLIQVKAESIANWGFISFSKEDLFIKIDGKKIVTLFFCPANDTANYLAIAKSLYIKHIII